MLHERLEIQDEYTVDTSHAIIISGSQLKLGLQRDTHGIFSIYLFMNDTVGSVSSCHGNL